MWARLYYLRTRQKKVTIDFSKETTLHYAFWSYLIQFALFVFYIYLLFQIPYSHRSMSSIGILLLLTSFIPALVFVSLLFRLKTRVVIGAGKQITFITFSRHGTIHSDQIAEYSCNSYFYYITKKDGKVSKIPATLSKSEVVMAFLEKATNSRR